MGLGTLVTRTGVILNTFFDDIRAILIGDFVGRNSTGAPVAGNNLGNALYPWGAAYFNTAVVGGVALSTTTIESSPFKTISGKTRTTSNQAQFITPAGGTTLNFTVQATATPLVLSVGGQTTTLTADLSPTAMSVGPAAVAANQAVVNDSTAASQVATRLWGEYSGANTINIGTVGANITAGVGTKIGQWAAFQIAGTANEYFLAYVESATQLTRAFRGFFYGSNLAPINRTTFSNGATIQLMNLGWVFIDVNGTTVDVLQSVTNNNPVFSATAPASPLTNDYWFNLSTQTWSKYSGTGWVGVNRHLVGLVLSDSFGCQAARCFEFWSLARVDNTVELTVDTTAQMKTTGLFQFISVAGKRLLFQTSRLLWNSSSSLAAATERYNATVVVSSTEYCYITDTGVPLLSDIEPYWRADLLGYYHPHNTWRAVGYNSTDSSANFQSGTLGLYGSINGRLITYGSIPTAARAIPAVFTSASTGNGSFSVGSTIATISGVITTGKPVSIFLQPDNSGNYSNGYSAASALATLSLYRDGNPIAYWTLPNPNNSLGLDFPTSSLLNYIDVNCPAGIHTYVLKGGTMNINWCVLVAREV